MKIDGRIALVTGANRGIGELYVRALLEWGAKRVCASARNPGTINIHGAECIALNITRSDESSVRRE